jgi:SAM-dependent methyltransferase
MGVDDAARWDERHAAHAQGENAEPIAFLRDHLALLPRGSAIDLACGAGRNAVWLARQGFDVLAVDVSTEALAQVEQRARAEGVSVRTLQRDLAVDGLPAGEWDLVVDTYFLERSLFDAMRRALRPGGALIFETFTMRHAERTGFNRRWCLEPGELLRAFSGLRIAAYREHEVDGRDIASLLAFA